MTFSHCTCTRCDVPYVVCAPMHLYPVCYSPKMGQSLVCANCPTRCLYYAGMLMVVFSANVLMGTSRIGDGVCVY